MRNRLKVLGGQTRRSLADCERMLALYDEVILSPLRVDDPDKLPAAVFAAWKKKGLTGSVGAYPGPWFVRRMVRRCEARVAAKKGR